MSSKIKEDCERIEVNVGTPMDIDQNVNDGSSNVLKPHLSTIAEEDVDMVNGGQSSNNAAAGGRSASSSSSPTGDEPPAKKSKLMGASTPSKTLLGSDMKATPNTIRTPNTSMQSVGKPVRSPMMLTPNLTTGLTDKLVLHEHLLRTCSTIGPNSALK